MFYLYWTLAIGAGRFSQIASPRQREFCNGGIFKPTITKFPLPGGAIWEKRPAPMAKVQL